MRKEDIKPLLELQEVDEEIERVERRIRSIEEDRSRLEEKLSKLREELKDLLSRRDELISRRKQIKEEIEAEEEMLAKTEKKMSMVRKDVEYKALLKEKAKHEDNILKKSYELDELNGKIKDIEDKLKEAEPRIKRRIKEIEEELEDLEIEKETAVKKLERLKKERKSYEQNINREILTFYEEARKRFGSRVVVPAEGGVCGGCGIKIPDVLFSKLIKEDNVEICPSCGRYIYYRL